MTGTRKPETFNWGPENIQRLKDYWSSGLSGSAIAEQFGDGLTKNAVAGKVNRLGLESRKKSSPAQSAKTKKVRQNPFIGSLWAPIQPKPDPLPLYGPPRGNLVPFLKINYRTCRSVEGHEPGGLALYCSNEKAPGESFCKYHQSIYYRSDYR